jgi:hypothetical protein
MIVSIVDTLLSEMQITHTNFNSIGQITLSDMVKAS